MAEIRVEHKKKTPIWPWIIGILILLGLIWLLLDAFDEDDPQDRMEDRMEEVEGEADEVGYFSNDNEPSIALNIYQSPDLGKASENIAA